MCFWQRLCLSIFLVLYTTQAEEKKWDENIERILRVQIEKDGGKIVTMSDGELLVTFVHDSNSKIVDCNVNRRRRISLGMLKYDVGIYQFKIFLFEILYKIFYYHDNSMTMPHGREIMLLFWKLKISTFNGMVGNAQNF